MIPISLVETDSVTTFARLPEYERAAAFKYDASSNGACSSPPSTEMTGNNSTSKIELNLPPVITQWTKAFDREFDMLATFALEGRLSSAQRSRFNQLKELRRSLHHPRSTAEILFEEERNEKLDNLLAALREYVEFFDTHSPNKAR